LERLEKLSRIENNIKLNKLNAVYDILTEEQTILRKRNKILKIADRHGWDTGKENLDSPSADDKEDASDLRAAISRANRKRSTPKPYSRPDNQYNLLSFMLFSIRDSFSKRSKLNEYWILLPSCLNENSAVSTRVTFSFFTKLKWRL
jgi:hypothetical protein